jgi:hypothetical protein
MQTFGDLSALLSRDILRGHSPWRWPTRFIVSSVTQAVTVEPSLTAVRQKSRTKPRINLRREASCHIPG